MSHHSLALTPRNVARLLGAIAVGEWRLASIVQATPAAPDEVHLLFAHRAVPVAARVALVLAHAWPHGGIPAGDLVVVTSRAHRIDLLPVVERAQEACARAVAEALRHCGATRWRRAERVARRPRHAVPPGSHNPGALPSALTAEGDPALAAWTVEAVAGGMPLPVLYDALHERLARAGDSAQRFAAWALVVALEEGIVTDILRTAHDAPLALDYAAVATRVVEDRCGAHPALARWAVETWCRAFERPLAADPSDREAGGIGRPPLPPPLAPSFPPQRVAGSRRGPLGEPVVEVPPGRFVMGSAWDDPERGSTRSRRMRPRDEAPHEVVLTRAFELGATPVTQALWRRVRGEDPPSNFRGDDLPVEQVTFYDAVRFCNAASRAAGLPEAYRIEGDHVTWPDPSAPGYRLPTEGEWEYACRAGTTTPYSTGERLTSHAANFDGLYAAAAAAWGPNWGRTSPTCTFAPNPWGLFDMHGNVWEWCWDWYGPYPDSACVDPTGPTEGTHRVLRGGSWLCFRSLYCRSAFRFYGRPDETGYDMGFRLARTLPRG